eukprot:253580-Chlamydomonas_euryale.AAC.1
MTQIAAPHDNTPATTWRFCASGCSSKRVLAGCLAGRSTRPRQKSGLGHARTACEAASGASHAGNHGLGGSTLDSLTLCRLQVGLSTPETTD